MDSRHFESRRGKAVHRRVKVFIVFQWFYCVSLPIWMPGRWVIPAWHRVDTFCYFAMSVGRFSKEERGGGHKVACYSRDFSNLTLTFPLVLLSFKILKRFPT